MVIMIKNMHNVKPVNLWDVKVDRSTRLGNPYQMGVGMSRERACIEYEKYFYEKAIYNPSFKEKLDSLIIIYKVHGQLSLFCWCAPLRCHAETIKRYLEKELKAQNIAL